MARIHYQYSGRPELASLAAAIRAEGTTKTRQVFPLRDFRGVNPADIK